MSWIDVTRPLAATLAGWPGDTPVRYALRWSRREGASVNVGQLEFSLHAGTHCDANAHFQDDAQTSDQLDPLAFCGLATVVDARGVDSITADLLPDELEAHSRILFRTDRWLDSARFPESIPVLTPAAISRLGGHRVALAGFDLPSVDPLDCRALTNHHALAAHGIVILEGLDLSNVVPGRYEMLALPMRIEGADGAPVRALLRPVNPGVPADRISADRISIG